MRFLSDAQLPPAFARRLNALGHKAEHVNDIGMGAAKDAEIWDYAVKHRAVIVSKDQDFADRAKREKTVVAVVWIRIGNTTTTVFWRMMKPLMPEILTALDQGERLIEDT